MWAHKNAVQFGFAIKHDIYVNKCLFRESWFKAIKNEHLVPMKDGSSSGHNVGEKKLIWIKYNSHQL